MNAKQTYVQDAKPCGTSCSSEGFSVSQVLPPDRHQDFGEKAKRVTSSDARSCTETPHTHTHRPFTQLARGPDTASGSIRPKLHTGLKTSYLKANEPTRTGAKLQRCGCTRLYSVQKEVKLRTGNWSENTARHRDLGLSPLSSCAQSSTSFDGMITYINK